MSSHVMDDVQEVCDRIVMIHKGKIVVQGKIDELVSQVEPEIEISVWGGASEMEGQLISMGISVRRLGRNMRVSKTSEDTYSRIMEAASLCGVQVRKMSDYEPDLEDIFLLIMDKLGEEVKGTDDLMTDEHKGVSA